MCNISVIIPVYNEEATLDILFGRLREVIDSRELEKYSFEIIFVNDGSVDGSFDKIKDFSKGDERVKFLSFSRNFGKEASLMAGLKFCSGDCAIPMDADLQDPPELILEFVKKWEEGYDMVYGMRKLRKSDTPLKRRTSEFFYMFYNAISETPLPFNAGDYRLINRRVIEAVLSLHEKSVFMKGLFNWVGFKSIGVLYERPQRAAGKTKWTYWRLWNLAMDGIIASTTLPLRIWTYLGSAVAVVSALYAAYIFVRTLIVGIDVPGYASLFVAIVFFGSVQLIALGIFGEYLARMLADVRKRPLYIIDKISSNFSAKKDEKILDV